jgi:hypothetical protein
MCYIYTVDYFSAIMKNEIMSFAGTWMKGKIRHDKPSSERQIPYALSYMWNPVLKITIINNNKKKTARLFGGGSDGRGKRAKKVME